MKKLELGTTSCEMLDHFSPVNIILHCFSSPDKLAKCKEHVLLYIVIAFIYVLFCYLCVPLHGTYM